MAVLTLESFLRRDRAVVAAALAAIALLSWVYIILLLWQMDHAAPLAAGGGVSDLAAGGFILTDMDMWQWARAGIAMLATPQAADLPVLVLMWLVVIIGMMMPSASRLILLHARVARQAAAKGQPFAGASWFAAGYLLGWIGFSILAALAQIWLQRQALLAPAMDNVSRLFSSFVLLAAGLFQWGALKEPCFSGDPQPARFIQRHGGFRPEPGRSLRLGLLHGGSCLGSCWALMALLFVGGVMNMLWIAVLSILVLLEKIVPPGREIARFSGGTLLALGGWILLAELA